MSAYSDWKCGAISDEEYTTACNMEAARDKALEEKDFFTDVNCDYYDNENGKCSLTGCECDGCE